MPWVATGSVGHCTGTNDDVGNAGDIVVEMFIVVTICMWFWKSVSGGFGDGNGSTSGWGRNNFQGCQTKYILGSTGTFSGIVRYTTIN